MPVSKREKQLEMQIIKENSFRISEIFVRNYNFGLNQGRRKHLELRRGTTRAFFSSKRHFWGEKLFITEAVSGGARKAMTPRPTLQKGKKGPPK